MSEVYCDEEEPVFRRSQQDSEQTACDAWTNNMTGLYRSVDETATKSLSEAGTQVARTIEEFLRAVCAME